MEKTDEEKSVDDITTTTFSIAGCPISVFKRFLKFAENNAQMTKVFYDKAGQKQIKKELCYSIALAQLLDAVEADAKVKMLYEKIAVVEEQVKQLGNKGT